MILATLLPAVALAAAPAPSAPTPPPVLIEQRAQGEAPASAQLDDPLVDPATVALDPTSRPKPRHARGDPLEGFNRGMFGIHQTLDKAIYRPVAMGYKHIVPKPARSGLRNFFTNLTEPIVFLNYLLQLKPGKAAETFARFGINSTLGLAGFFDIAKREDFKLPHRDNGFGSTLARYGVGPGPYLFLPFLGPSTLRDFVGTPVDGAVLPVAIGVPFDRAEYQLASGLLIGLDRRAEADPELRALFAGAVDPYATLRSAFLQSRAAEVAELRGRRGKKPQVDAPELDDPLTDPDASGAHELQDPLADPAIAQPEAVPPRL